jgi:hypothetical protein
MVGKETVEMFKSQNKCLSHSSGRQAGVDCDMWVNIALCVAVCFCILSWLTARSCTQGRIHVSYEVQCDTLHCRMWIKLIGGY